MPKTMKQPYNLNPAGGPKIASKIGSTAENYVIRKFKTTNKLLDHELGLREMAVKSHLKRGEIKTAGKQQRKAIKTGGKQERKTIVTQGGVNAYQTKVENKQQRKNMTHTVNSAAQLKAKPGTRATIQPDRVDFVTTGGPAAAAKKKTADKKKAAAKSATKRTATRTTARDLPAGAAPAKALPAGSAKERSSSAKPGSYADHPNIFSVTPNGTATKTTRARAAARPAAKELTNAKKDQKALPMSPDRSNAVAWEQKLKGQEAAALAARKRK